MFSIQFFPRWPLPGDQLVRAQRREKRTRKQLRTFARNFSNIDFFLKILPVKVDELVMSEM